MIATILNLLLKLNKSRNIERTYQSVVMAQNHIMQMACVRIVIMLKEEQRELTFVVTQREFSMLKVFAKIAI